MAVARGVLVGALALSSLTAATAQPPSSATYLSQAQASPVFAALGEPVPAAREWGRWIAAADAATRARVAQGDEGSIVNLLLFGTSFTTQPRITSAQVNSEEKLNRAVSARIDDFAQALAQPGTNERLQYARRLLGDSASVRPHLLAMLDRVIKEGETLARLTKEAEALGDPSLQFAERSRLYRNRGLSSDTSVRINYAVEDALRSLRPVVKSVRRAAIIGPGLDFADKQEGYDFYPPQTIQPFAVIDSLIRLGLSDAATIRVTTFDVSARVNDHITEMTRKARGGTPYTLYLPLDGTTQWTTELLSYVKSFGFLIARPSPVTVPPGLGPLRLRAVAVRPSVVERISARDINITAELPTLDEGEPFDLIVGTNIFLYYDRLQQGLAVVNISGMLRPGGILLSNNALVEVPSAGMRSIRYLKTMYSTREEDGDLIIAYQKLAGSR